MLFFDTYNLVMLPNIAGLGAIRFQTGGMCRGPLGPECGTKFPYLNIDGVLIRLDILKTNKN